MRFYPKWFKLGCLVKFHGFGSAVKVLEIDEEENQWLAEDSLGKGTYPLDEVESFWKPQNEWLSSDEIEKKFPSTNGMHTDDGSPVAEPKGFHAADGLYFNREPNGDVRIKKEDKPGSSVMEIILDKDVWASAVASVSKLGEINNRFYTAQKFHNEEAPQP